MSDYPPQNPGSNWGDSTPSGSPASGADDSTKHIPAYGQPPSGSPSPGSSGQGGYQPTQQFPPTPGQPASPAASSSPYGQPGQPSGGGYGQQPGYGQQGGGYGQQPGYGQQGGGYGQQPGYGAPTPGYGGGGGGQPPYPPPGGYGGTPPGSGGGNRNAIIAAVVAVVVVAAGIIIAIVATGGDDKKNAGGSGSPTPTAISGSGSESGFPSDSASAGSDTASSGSGGSSASDTLDTFNAALRDHDATAVRATLCSDVGSGAQQLESLMSSDLSDIQDVMTAEPPSSSGSTAQATITVTLQTTSRDFLVSLSNESSGWCVQDFARSGSSGSDTSSDTGGSAVGLATLAGIRYFAALQAHSLQGVKDVACTGVRITETQSDLNIIDTATASPPATVTGSTGSILGTITGNGKSAKLKVNLRVDTDGTTWCVSSIARA